MPRPFALLVAACLCASLPAAAQTPLNMSISYFGYWTGSAGSPRVVFSDSRGAAAFGPRIVLALARSSTPAPLPPYRIELELEPGFLAIAPLSLPAGTTCQPATGGGAAPLRIECLLTTQLGGGGVQFQFALDAGPIGDFAGAQVNARYTVDYDAFPLPDPPVCTTISGNTGCVQSAAAVFGSWVRLDSLAIADPVTVGANTALRVNHRVVGYDGGRISTTRIDLPPQLEYVATSSSTSPIHTCASAPGPGGGERVTCLGNIRHVSANGAPRTGNFDVIVRTRPGVKPPGPLRVVASIGNDLQPAPEDCDANPDQDACAVVEFGLAPPPVVDLRLVASSAPQPWTQLGRVQGPFRIEYRNAGGLPSAAPTRLLAKLPPGFAFGQLTGASGTVACSAAGTPADGQEVRCQRSTTVPAGSATFWLELSLLGDPLLAAEAGNLVVWAIADGSADDGATLLACAADPALPHCRWQVFDVRPPCPGGPDDSIYCDGYQVFVPPPAP